MVMVAGEEKPVYLAPAIAEKLSSQPSEKLREGVRRFTRQLNPDATGYARKGRTLAGARVDVIVLEKDLSPSKEMNLTWTLDHEIGHHILRNGTDGLHLQVAESAADAYATLRHMQRFGKDTQYIRDYISDSAAYFILHGDKDHYTADAVERALAVAEDMGDKFFRLSERETAKMAADIADENTLDAKTLQRVRAAWKPMKEIFNPAEMAGDDIRATFLSVLQKYPGDAAVRDAGERFLDNLLPAWRRKLHISQADIKAAAKIPGAQMTRQSRKL